MAKETYPTALKFVGASGPRFVYEGELFREGVYAERNITVTRDKIDFIARTTNPGVPLRLEHADSVLDEGLRGFGLLSIEARDATDAAGNAVRILWGRVSVPAWLREAKGDSFSVSVGFLEPINGGESMSALGEISVVDEPRVTTAKLQLAFSAYKAKFATGESYDDLRNRVSDGLMSLMGIDPSTSLTFWVADLYPDSVVYSLGGKLYQRSYTANGAGFVFGEPVEVARRVSYLPVAALGSAYSSARRAKAYSVLADLFAGKRNSSLDQQRIQQILELAIQLGAVPPEEAEPDDDPDDQTAAQSSTRAGKAKEVTRMNPFEKIKGLFKKRPELLAEAGVTAIDLDTIQAEPTPTDQFASKSADPALEARFSAMANQMKAQGETMLNQAAEAFARDVVYVQKRATPAQLQEFAGFYRDAVKADAGNDALFSDAGKPVEGVNVANLRKMVEKLPSRSALYTDNAIADGNDFRGATTGGDSINVSQLIGRYNRGNR